MAEAEQQEIDEELEEIKRLMTIMMPLTLIE